MNRQRLKVLAILIGLSMSPIAARADVTLPKVIGSHMVLQLWKQKDVTEKAVDGGERICEFHVGKNKGKFKLVNAAPKHLLPFLSETQQLINSIDEAARDAAKKK